MIEIKIEQKEGRLGFPARVLIYENNKLINEIVATVESKTRPGNDYEFYPNVTISVV